MRSTSPGRAAPLRSAGITGSKAVKLLDLLHRWGGGLLGLILAVLGLSGAILVHKEEWIGLPHAADARVTDTARLGQLADRLLAGASGGESIVFASDRFGLVQLRDGAGGFMLRRREKPSPAGQACGSGPSCGCSTSIITCSPAMRAKR